MRPRSRGRRAGYTLVELMMALALFTVAVLGIVSLQKITVVSNSHAKNLAIAQRIAQSWSNQLQMDASNWRTSLDPNGVLKSPDSTWRRPNFVTGRLGGAFDALGNPLSDASAALVKQQARFCTHVRFSYLYGPNLGASGNEVVRAEIRVFWQRDGQGQTIDGIGPTEDYVALGLCPQNQVVGPISQAVGSYHFVYQTVALRQNSRI